MFNNSGDKVCELLDPNTSSSDWGQIRRSVLFPPLGNCNSIDQERVSSPLAATVSPQREYSEKYSWPKNRLLNAGAHQTKAFLIIVTDSSPVHALMKSIENSCVSTIVFWP